MKRWASHQGMAWVERILFAIGLLLVIQPVTSTRFHVTHDGPSHALNAHYLGRLISGTAADDRQWELNPVPVPNWSGHAVLAAAMQVLDAPEALKALYLLCLLGLPLAFRWSLNEAGDQPPWGGFLGLPLAMHGPFQMGFLNFSLGLVGLLLVMRMWRGMLSRSATALGWLRLAALLLLLYASHLVPFAIALAWGLLHWAEAYSTAPPASEERRALRQMLPRLGLAAAPALACLAAYLALSPGHGANEPMLAPPDNLVAPLLDALCASDRAELRCWAPFAALLGVMVLLNRVRHGTQGRAAASIGAEGWAVAFTALLFVIMPDRVGKGSGLSIRLALLLYLALALLLARRLRAGPAPLLLPASVITLLLCLSQVRRPGQELRSHQQRQAYEASVQVPRGARVVTLPCHWMVMHHLELGLADRDALLLSNYEFINPHFPLRWSPVHDPLLNPPPPDPLDGLIPLTNVPGAWVRGADAILITGDTLNAPAVPWRALSELLRSHYRLAARVASNAVYLRIRPEPAGSPDGAVRGRTS
ncbi:MAG: hypothetical protein QY325_12880 [Flavobacteriales bacterium]|nr:MAG: hypothetical protein QY325_12880 [Flavobacteriales bacterium]